MSASSIAVIKEDASRGGRDVHYVYAPTIDSFTDDVVGAVIDGGIRSNFWFALGFAAGVNALASDSIDFAQPVITVEQALADMESVSDAKFAVTDALRGFCERTVIAR